MESSDTNRGEWHASRGEQFKVICDYLKHIATLSAGSILLIVTMLDKVFAHPTSRGLVSYAVAGFIVSLIASTLAFLMTAVMFPRPAANIPGDVERNIWATFVIFTCGGFIVGVGAMALFFWSNW